MEKTENLGVYEKDSLYQPVSSEKITNAKLKEYQEFCERVWEFLRGKEYPPIKVIDTHHRHVIAGCVPARCVLEVLRCSGQGGINWEALKDAVGYDNILQNDEESIDYKIKWLLDMDRHPYLEIDSGQLRCTPRAVREEEYLKRIASEENERASAEEQLTVFKTALDSLSQLGKEKYLPALRELACWIVTEFPEYTLFEAIRILDAYSVTDIKTYLLLGHIPKSGITKDELIVKATAGDGDKRIWGPIFRFDEWVDVKLMGLERLGMIREDEKHYVLTDYGVYTLCLLWEKTEKELGLDPNSSTAIVASGQQALESTFSDVSDLIQRIEAINSPDDLYRLESAIQKKRTELELTEAEPRIETSGDREHPGPDTSTSRLARIFDVFASLSREDKEKFLNVVAWAKPVELIQPQSAAYPDGKKSFVERLNGGAENLPAAVEFPKDASALEIMRRAYVEFSKVASSVSEENEYDLILCHSLRMAFGNIIEEQLGRIHNAGPDDKIYIAVPRIPVNRETGEPLLTPTAHIRIDAPDGSFLGRYRVERPHQVHQR